MRIELMGEGTPIPTEGLPDPNISDELPPQSLILTNGVPFLKFDYVGLGYTHYEVVCIGAVGGRGGDIFLPPIYSYGGGGGGGGLHRTAGLLADLPEICPVVVGSPGADGADGNGYEVSHPSYIAPQNGQGGGYSSFNGITCRASGGKGGLATMPRPDYSFDDAQYPDTFPGGSGGEGGIGDQTVTGGGAAGAFSIPVFGVEPPYAHSRYLRATLTAAQDGTWNGVVGSGGGGGRGGTCRTAIDVSSPEVTEQASSGGQGSFSYADTSVYGPRGNRRTDPIHESSVANSKVIFPGSGGGARLSVLQGYGSRATGFSPNGVVQIRVMKIV